MHQNFLVLKENGRRKKKQWEQAIVLSGCLTEMYHITPMFEITAHTYTSVLTITYSTHIIALTSGTHWTMGRHKFHCRWQWLLGSLCPSFYDYLYLQYISNALLIVVLWAHVFTLHFKCGCLWNGLEWKTGRGKKDPVSYFLLSPSLSLSYFSLPLSLSPWRLMIKMSSISFPPPSTTFSRWGDNINHWNGSIIPRAENKWFDLARQLALNRDDTSLRFSLNSCRNVGF